MRWWTTPTPLALSLLAVAGCSSSSKVPVLASSSGQSSYAMHYSDELGTATKGIADAQARHKTLTGGFPGHVDEVKKTDWGKVDTIIDDSDEAGRSADFGEAAGEAAVVKGFLDSEKNDLAMRMNGNASHQLKEAGCSADLGGKMSWAMNDAIQKSMQKKLRSKNEAFLVIERNKTSLGPQNVPALEKLADEIAEASYTVNVLMVGQHERLQRLAKDRDDVKKTLDRFIKEENDLQAEPGRSPEEKKASQDRINAANKSKAEIDGVAQQADAVSKESEKALDAAKKEYASALKAAKDKVAERKKAEPPPPPPKA